MLKNSGYRNASARWVLRETRKNALKNSGFEVRVLVDLVEKGGGFVLGPFLSEKKYMVNVNVNLPLSKMRGEIFVKKTK